MILLGDAISPRPVEVMDAAVNVRGAAIGRRTVGASQLAREVRSAVVHTARGDICDAEADAGRAGRAEGGRRRCDAAERVDA